MRRLTYFLFLMLVVSQVTKAQTQFQVLLDTVAGPDPVMRKSIVTEDGRTVLAFPRNDGTMLFIADADGTAEAVLNVNVPIRSNECYDIAPRPGGGLVLATLSLIEVLHESENQFDTVRLSFTVCSITPSHTVEWTKTCSFEMLDFQSGPGGYFHTSIRLKTTPSGVFMAIRTGFYPVTERFLKFSTAGDLEWSEKLELFVVDESEPLLISPALDGGCFFAFNEYGAADAAMTMGRLSSQGELLWMRSFEYTNNIVYMKLHDLITSQDNEPITIGGLGGFGLAYGYLLKVSPEGTAFDGHFYQASGSMTHECRSAQPLDNGELLVFSNGNFNSQRDHVLMRLSTDLDVLADARTSKSIVGQIEYAMQPTSFSSAGASVILAGSMRTEDQVFGYTEHRPSIWKFNLDDLDGCLMEDTVITHYEIPTNLIDVTDLMPNATADATPDSTSSEPATLTPLPLIPVLSLCEQLVGLEELHATVTGITISPNPAAKGHAVSLFAEGAAVFEVRSVLGALVAAPVRANHLGKATLNVELNSGPYVVIARNRSGSAIGRANLILQ